MIGKRLEVEEWMKRKCEDEGERGGTETEGPKRRNQEGIFSNAGRAGLFASMKREGVWKESDDEAD